MLNNIESGNTKHAECIIERYKKELKFDVVRYMYPYLPHRDDHFAEDARAYYCFPYLYSALFHSPSESQLGYIGDTAYNVIRGRDAFYVEMMMKRANAENIAVDFEEWDRCFSADKSYCDRKRALLICGLSHPDGYFREQCLRRFSGLSYTLQFVLMRLNDWVPEVRCAASEVFAEQLKRKGICSELISSMPFVEYVRRGERAHRDSSFSMDAFDDTLLRHFEEYSNAVLSAPKEIRGLCYKVFTLHPKRKYKELIMYFFTREHDGEFRRRLESIYLQLSEGTVPEKVYEIFTSDRYESVRLLAYEYRFGNEGIWNGFEKLLFSSSYRIRAFAEKHLEKSGFDIINYCRDNLPETILALSDTGSADDVSFIRPYLETHTDKALTALVRLDAADKKELIWKYMHSENNALAKTAYRLALSEKCFDIPYLLSALPEAEPKLQWRLIRLLTKDGVWNVMDHLLRFACDCPSNRRNIQYLIRKNTGRKVHVSEELNGKIQKALRYARDANAIPLDINNQIFNDMR